MNTELSLWGYFVKCVTKKYCCFSGRARRKEFWGFALFYALIIISLFVIWDAVEGAFGTKGGNVLPILFFVVILGLFLPGLGVVIRRLHDTGRSGWWYFIHFVPYVGALVLLVFYCLDSQPGANEYGPNPKELA